MGESAPREPTFSQTYYDTFDRFKLVSKNLYEFYKKELLCDVEIKVGVKSIKCHKIVLACCSPYFSAMFTTPLSESQQQVIVINEIEDFALEQLINYFYSASVELTPSNAQSLLHAASVLQVDSLAQICCSYFKTQIHSSNCLAICQLADCYGLKHLLNYAEEYTFKHFYLTIQGDEFCKLPLKSLIKLISSPNIIVSSEREVYLATMKWIRDDIETKKMFLYELLSQLHLYHLPTTFLQTEVKMDSLIHQNLACRDLIDQVLNYHLWLANPLSISRVPFNPKMRPRKCYAGMILCVGGRSTGDVPLSSTECYDCLANQWLTKASMAVQRRHVGCVCHDGLIYVAGGCNEKRHLDSAEVFDPLINAWRSIADLSIPRRGIGLCALGGAIYAVGGLDHKSAFSIVERYDIAQNIWTCVEPLQTPRGGAAVVAFQGYLYALGGEHNGQSLDSCERYDPYLNKWSTICPMNHKRGGAGAVAYDGYIFALGGFHKMASLSSLEYYDPRGNGWKLMSSMSIPRGGVAVAQLGGFIYAIGGHDGSKYIKEVEVYEPHYDK